MGETTNIEWTMCTWNPWHGCHKVSAECKFCYMFRDKKRYGQDPNVVVRSKTGFYDPLKWTEPKAIFTCSWSDFFIEEADPWRDEAFAIMALTPQHTYQILTKRPDRMKAYVDRRPDIGAIMRCRFMRQKNDHKTISRAPARGLPHSGAWEYCDPNIQWPLPNVWLGISAGDQETADERIPILLQTPAALRFLSLEPLLGPIDLIGKDAQGSCLHHYEDDPIIDWVITGGESGPGARPSHPQWFSSLRNQCHIAGVPFFFKQWGEWAPTTMLRNQESPLVENLTLRRHTQYYDNGDTHGCSMMRVGKKRAGRLLDGRTWDEMPKVNS